MFKYLLTLYISLLSFSSNAGLFDYFDFSDKPTQIKQSESSPNYTQVNKKVSKDLAEPDFNLSESPQLHHETVIKDSEYLKTHYEELVLILKSFSSLEHNLRGYEERKVVSNLKNFFKDKYLLNQTDLIDIRNNLNEVIKK